ncbi:hypothetical protein CI105_07975 [Candidatus Izimaplasma bacterium ZiA1]|uniref:Bax inhibitor-1/YccA family protein n=1 Tax=Candidatus Izimoplasma sp. ZiA1 TaxID=2024899 RepID=UPI000BAA6DDB|nr:hypothetical protein CI105_07975 [Candidatus Izimaplasma bacterium ZiA1]
MRFRGANPVYTRMNDFDLDYSDQVTYTGVTVKSFLLLMIVAVFAMFSGRAILETGTFTGGIGFLIAAPLIGMVSLFIALRNPRLSMVFSIIYAIAEGTFLGVLSAIYALTQGNDVVITAVFGTFGVLFGMLFLFDTGIIRVGSKFKKFLFSALIGLIIASLFMFVGSLFGLLSTTGGYGLYTGIAVLSTVIASLYLLSDFDDIKRMVESGAPKEYEWTLALGLIVTLVWLYIELLRLIAIFKD